LQIFDQAYIGGGTTGDPSGSLMSVVLYIYNAMVRQLNFDYAGAIGVILFVIVFSATLIQRQLFGRTTAVD
jgi:ABC-type sugar transport system permease subunit